jgi:hypothetical protein
MLDYLRVGRIKGSNSVGKSRHSVIIKNLIIKMVGLYLRLSWDTYTFIKESLLLLFRIVLETL